MPAPKRKRNAVRPPSTKRRRASRSVALAKPADTTSVPTGRVARPAWRDMRETLARLSDLTPERLGTILRNAERGETADFIDLCDRMETTDGCVRANIETRVAAIAGADWVLEPGVSGDAARDAQAEAGADFVSAILENARGGDPDEAFDVMRVGFRAATGKLLNGIAKGFACLEIPWEYDEATRITAPKCFLWTHQRRFRWEPSDSTLRLVDDGVTLERPGKELVPKRWLVHMPTMSGAYPWVSGAFRVIAWCYLFKRWTRRFWVSGAETFSYPFLWGKVPRGADAATRAEALRGLEELSADHRAVVEDPVAFQILESTVKDAGTWKQLEDALDREIAKAILGSTDQTQPDKVGAYGAVESRRGTTVEPRIAIDERNLAEDWERQFFEPLLSINRHLFGGVVPAIPSIRWTIAAKRREIPTQILETGKVTTDEARASIGLKPLGGEEGARFIEKRPAVESVLKAIELARGAGMQPTAASVQKMLGEIGIALEPIPDGAPQPKAIPLAPTDIAKVVSVEEARASVGLAPFGDERDEMTVTELGEAAAAPAPAPAPAPAAPPVPAPAP